METGNVLICTVKITQVCLLLLLVPSSSSQTDQSILVMQPGRRERVVGQRQQPSCDLLGVTFKLLAVI